MVPPPHSFTRYKVGGGGYIKTWLLWWPPAIFRWVGILSFFFLSLSSYRREIFLLFSLPTTHTRKSVEFLYFKQQLGGKWWHKMEIVPACVFIRAYPLFKVFFYCYAIVFYHFQGYGWVTTGSEMMQWISSPRMNPYCLVILLLVG